MPEKLPDFVERIDLIRAKIKLVGNDYVTVLALPLCELAQLQKLDLAGAEIEALVDAFDGVLSHAIQEWSLTEVCSACGDAPPPAVGSLSAEERKVVWTRMPASVLVRIIEGLVAHSGG